MQTNDRRYIGLLQLDTNSKLSWPTVVEREPKCPFPIATTSMSRWGCKLFLWIAPLTFDPYFIMLSLARRHEVPFLSLWYSISDWIPVSRTTGEHSNHYANCCIFIGRCMQKHNHAIIDERTQFFRKIYLSLYLKVFERVTKGFTVWKMSWRLKRTATYWNPTLMTITAFLSRSPGLLNQGLGTQYLWDMVLIPVSSL